VRRLSANCGIFLFLASAALRLAASTDDSPAMRCAIACGHAAGMTKGAVCCPMSDAPGSGPVWKTCAPGADAAVAPLAPIPFLLASVGRLPAPEPVRRLGHAVGAAVRPPFLRAPEKVPLLLG
jgi:hypothetical protein